MTDEIKILSEALEEYKKVLILKNMNQELLVHLHGIYLWLFKYSEKTKTPLPKKDQLMQMAEKADFLIEEIVKKTNQPISTRRKTTDDSPEPK